MSNPKMWRYNLVWKKGDRSGGFLNANRMPLRNHEDIAVFYQQLPTYNPQKTKGAVNHGRGNIVSTKNRCYGKFDITENDLTGMKFPTSILDFEKEHDGKQFHPTQKPVDLLRYLILTYSNEGGVILDATMGSGTTAVAALMEHRHFIGFELNKEYYDKAVKRIKAEQSQLSLF